MMRVIIVKVGKKPLIEEIPEDRKSIRKAVGGVFEKRRPFKDQSVAVVTTVENETMNRWIVDEDGNSKFIAKGDFILCKIDQNENLCGFTPQEAKKWKGEMER